MDTLKYKVIKSKTQYKDYCSKLEELIFLANSKETRDEIDLLTLLIEKWDADHNTFLELDPIQLLHSLLCDHKLKPKDLVSLLNLSKGNVSDILNYKKGLSKEVIRKLAEHFKLSQEAFNRPYDLVDANSSRLRNARIGKTRKIIST